MTDKICACCGKEPDSDAIALCDKILYFKEVYCLDCLSKVLSCSRECIENIIWSYKERGCPAFT